MKTAERTSENKNDTREMFIYWSAFSQKDDCIIWLEKLFFILLINISNICVS